MKMAQKALIRIENSILEGKWQEMKTVLNREKDREQPMTVEQLSEVYLDEYCRARNKDVGFKRRSLKSLNKKLGATLVENLTRADAHQYVGQRSKQVANATVNREVAVLKNMFTFALERGFVENHPLIVFACFMRSVLLCV